MPSLTLVEIDAGELLRDHELYRQQAGFVSDGPAIDAVAETPTGQTLERLIGDGDQKTMAAILVDSHVSTTGARLAARFPEMPVYAWDPKARGTEDSLDIVGMLQPYGLAPDTREGQVQDAWERAARLIHERYVSTIRPELDAGTRIRTVGGAQRVLPWVQSTSGAQRAVGWSNRSWGTPGTPGAARPCSSPGASWPTRPH